MPFLGIYLLPVYAMPWVLFKVLNYFNSAQVLISAPKHVCTAFFFFFGSVL